MTDLQIAPDLLACVVVFAGYLLLCERVRAMNVLEVAGRARRRVRASSTCCGRCCAPRTSDVAAGDFLTLATLAVARSSSSRRSSGALHPPGHGGRARLPEPGPAARRAGDLPRLRRRRDRRAGLEGLRGRPCWSMAFVAIVAGYVVLRLQDVLPLNQGGIPAMSPGPRVQHVGQLRDQHQLAELLRRDRRDLPDPGRRCSPSATSPPPPPAWPIAIALFRGLTRRSAKTLGNYWVDLTRGVLYILLPISIVGALVLVWQGVPADVGSHHDRHDAPGRAADHRHRARSPRRSGSRSWATTAAASSTPTPPTRSRARRR